MRIGVRPGNRSGGLCGARANSRANAESCWRISVRPPAANREDRAVDRTVVLRTPTRAFQHRIAPVDGAASTLEKQRQIVQPVPAQTYRAPTMGTVQRLGGMTTVKRYDRPSILPAGGLRMGWLLRLVETKASMVNPEASM